jgi:hypothetical protein
MENISIKKEGPDLTQGTPTALTEDTASCRALHADAIVPTTGAFFMLTSNGAELTPDLADRSAFIRIAKQPDGYRWSKYGGEELSEHVKNRRVHYLGCIYSVLSEWIRQGKPQIDGAPHRFWQWACSMDWIVRNLFGLSPLLNGHKQVQKETGSSILVFLRQAAIKVQQEGRLGEEFRPFELVQLAQTHHLSIPSVKDITDDRAPASLGRQLGRLFTEGDTFTLDASFHVVRKLIRVKRKDGQGYDDGKSYAFFRTTVDPDDSSGPFDRGGPKSDPTNPSPRQKDPTTVEPTLEPRSNENLTSTVVSHPPQHHGVTGQNATNPRSTRSNTSIFA